MRLITSKLFIKPLNLFELEAMIRGLQEDEEVDFAVLPSRYRNQLFTDCLVKDIHSSLKKHPNTYLFNTIWLIIEKDTRNVAGHIFFSGNPNSSGEIELYSEIFEEESERLYLKESLNAIVAWAASVNRIKILRTNVPVNDHCISSIMRESGFERINSYQHSENWIWKNEKKE